MRWWPASWRSGESGPGACLDDLRSGQATWRLRLGLTLAAGFLAPVPLLFLLGLIEMTSGRVEEEHLAVGIGLAIATWCGLSAWLWHGYRRWRPFINTALTVLAVWALLVPICVWLAKTSRQAQFLVAGIIFLGVAASVVLIVTAGYRSRGGRAIADPGGAISVRCPSCGYSLIGLEACQCPECGATFTLDQIILAQDWAVLRSPSRPEHEGRPREEPDGERDEEPEGGAVQAV